MLCWLKGLQAVLMCGVWGGVYLELFLHVAMAPPAVVNWELGLALLCVHDKNFKNAGNIRTQYIYCKYSCNSARNT